MAQSETLDTSQPQSSSSASDPQLSRTLSSSRLNAQAPEFVPTRSTPQQQPQQSHRMMIPSPPPPGMLHVYPPPPQPPPSAFHLPVHSPVPMPPPHMVPIHHHMPTRNHHHHHNPYQNHHHHREQEVDAVAKKDLQKEHKDHGATSSKNGSPEEATSKILNQVRGHQILLAALCQLLFQLLVITTVCALYLTIQATCVISLFA